MNDRLLKHVALHPRVRHDLLERGAVRRLKLPHAVEQVFQLWRNEVGTIWLVLGVSSPEDVGTVVGDAFIEWIISLCAREWWMADHHNEQDNSRGEEVNLATDVALLKMDLRSHVVVCT